MCLCVFTAMIYYSKRIQSKISKEKMYMEQRPEETRCGFPRVYCHWSHAECTEIFQPQIGTTCVKCCLPGKLIKTQWPGTSLVVQWLRIHLPIQGTRVRSLVQEDPTCHRASKPVRHNYWARVLQLLKPMHLEPILCNKTSHCNEKPTHLNEE